MKARASDLQEQTEKEIKALKATIGELYVENAILKKASLVEKLGQDRILTLQGELIEEGIWASVGKLCTELGFNRSKAYYTRIPRKKHKQITEQWLVDEVCKVIEGFPEYGTREPLTTRRYTEL